MNFWRSAIKFAITKIFDNVKFQYDGFKKYYFHLHGMKFYIITTFITYYIEIR